MNFRAPRHTEAHGMNLVPLIDVVLVIIIFLMLTTTFSKVSGLEVNLPAQLTRYRISQYGLDELKQQYHMLAMPVQAWSDPAFMGLLLDNHLPYARLSLLRTAGAAAGGTAETLLALVRPPSSCSKLQLYRCAIISRSSGHVATASAPLRSLSAACISHEFP